MVYPIMQRPCSGGTSSQRTASVQVVARDRIWQVVRLRTSWAGDHKLGRRYRKANWTSAAKGKIPTVPTEPRKANGEPERIVDHTSGCGLGGTPGLDQSTSTYPSGAEHHLKYRNACTGSEVRYNTTISA